jgi:hypothetical protein
MNVELVRALEQLEEEKGISKDVIVEAIEAALRKVIQARSNHD